MRQTQTKYKFRDSSGFKKVVVQLNTPDGLIDVYWSEESGRVVNRKKIKTISEVDHPGIPLGRDARNRLWIAHNHYENKRPTIDLVTDFAKGMDVTYDNRRVDFAREEVVDRAVAEVLRGRAYGELYYNCQTYVNLVVQGEKKSEAVDNWTNGAMAMGGLFTLIGLLTGNKTLTGIGVGTLAVGAGIKVYSRSDWKNY